MKRIKKGGREKRRGEKGRVEKVLMVKQVGEKGSSKVSKFTPVRFLWDMSLSPLKALWDSTGCGINQRCEEKGRVQVVHFKTVIVCK